MKRLTGLALRGLAVALPFALTGPEPAAPAVAAFRRCTEGGLV